MNSAPSSIGRATPSMRRVWMRPPMRSRASTMQTRFPAPDRSRAAAKPAAPAPMMTTSDFTQPRKGANRVLLLSANLRPRKRADEHHLLVDLSLRRLVAEHAAQVLDFCRDQLVVLRKEANRCALEVAFRDSDELWGPGDVLAHTFPNDDCGSSNPKDEPITVYVCF